MSKTELIIHQCRQQEEKHGARADVSAAGLVNVQYKADHSAVQATRGIESTERELIFQLCKSASATPVCRRIFMNTESTNESSHRYCIPYTLYILMLKTFGDMSVFSNSQLLQVSTVPSSDHMHTPHSFELHSASRSSASFFASASVLPLPSA